MSARNLKFQSHFLEIASSLHLALKLTLLLLVVSWLGDGPLALALICVTFAAATRLMEHRLTIQDAAWRIVLACGVACMALNWTDAADSTRLPALPLTTLFLFYLTYSLRRQPFTVPYAQVDGIPVLRQQHATLWLVVYGISVLIWLLAPDNARWLVSLLALAGLGIHVYLPLAGIGPAWQPIPVRQIEDFKFVRIDNEPAKLRPLYALYVKELMPSLLEGDRFHNTPADEIVQKKIEADQPLWDDMVFFAAYHNEVLVGTLCCQFDHPRQPLPFENSHSQPLSLNRIRELGNIVELGKFCVAEDYRFMPEIFAGLLMCAVEIALARNVAFVVLQSVMKTARIYTKMGFSSITKEPVINLDHGVKVQLLAKNMASRGDIDNPIMGNADKTLSQYIFCRFVWRQIAKSAIAGGRKRRLPTSLTSDDLPALAEFQ